MSGDPSQVHVYESLTVGPYEGAAMDPTSLAAAMVGTQVSQLQLAAAAMMMRMNANNAGSVVQVIDAAQQNMNSLANLAAGVGQNIDISV